MSETLGAVLVAEVGHLITRVTLVDQVDGEARLVGHAETISSVELPYNNALYAILEAAVQISELTGRQLLQDGQLLMPQTSERDGVNHVVITTSAAGAMALVITAIASDVSARSALHASRSTYTAVLQVVTLDDAVAQPEASSAGSSWIERQVQALLNIRPDLVLITGGLEGGAVDAVNRLAHIVGLTALGVSVDASGQQRQRLNTRPVIYAGNSNARERVIEALSDRAEISVVENVRPALAYERLDPTRKELSRLYEKQILPRLPGIAALRRLSRTPIRTVCDVQGLMARFLAERAGRRVLLIDAGASSSSAFYAAPGSYHLAVLGDLGIAYSATRILAERGVGALMRWLPLPIAEADLTHRLLNKLLRPQVLPASALDLYIEHALASESLAMALAALRDEFAAADFDWVLAGGGVLAHAPHPGLALLTILNAIQPAPDHDRPLIDIHLDSLGLLQVCGALAGLDPDAAVTVFDRDLLRNTPLASCVVPLGEGRPGETAVEVELIVGGKVTQRTVRHGEIARLPLSQGRTGQLKLRPASGVRIGRAAPGEEMATAPGEVRGSALGLVIDARGRPLSLPSDPDQRRARIWEWLVELGVAQGATPASTSETAPIPAISRAPSASAAAPAPAGEVAASPAAGRRISLADLAAAEGRPADQPPSEVASGPTAGKRISLADLALDEPKPPAEPATGVESDLDRLRQTVEAPKKRGLFGRKK